MTPDEPRPPEQVVRPGPEGLRALAHPLRLQLLGLLRSDGPATATQLAARVAQTSGSTSYHLRQLAAAGLVLEDEARGNARDRWWRAGHRMTEFDVPPDADEETRAVGEQYLYAVADIYARKVTDAIASLPTVETDLGLGWEEAFTMSDYALRLTREEALGLIAELEALARRHRFDEPDNRGEAPDDAERVILQFQVMPRRS